MYLGGQNSDTRRGSSGASPEDAAKAAHERRREQIRRAQRTHRERKELYIKNLEKEVVVLREKDAAHDQVTAAFERKIAQLSRILVSHGIPIPPGLHIESPQAQISVQVQADGVQNLRATMPSLSHTQFQSWSPPQIVSSTTAAGSDRSDPLNLPEGTRFYSNFNEQQQPLRVTGQPQSKGHPYDLDAAQIAVDFVLDLERPCLSHHGPSLHDGEFNGHKLMVQTPIMAHANTPRPVANMDPGSDLPNDITWTVPAVEVDRLLNLSSRLSLEGELTPIEAWQKIKQHPGFLGMDRGRLEQFKAVLLPEVQCHGFGAVIDEQYFNFLMEQHMGPHSFQ